MATLADLASELKGYIAEIDYLLAVKLVNRALRDVYDSRLWSFLLNEGVFIAPQIITTGTVSLAQFSPTVTLSAAANAALNGLNNPFVTLRQFRGSPMNSGVYNIAAYDNVAGTLTLDRVWNAPSVTGASYQIYRCYYTPADVNGSPVTDFLSFVSMVNPNEGYRFSRRNLRMQRVEIDGMDPLRACQGLAYRVATYQYSTLNGGIVNSPSFELWPHPTSAAAYTFLMRRRGTDLVKPTDLLPNTLRPQLVSERARYYSALWAAQNVGRYPQLRGVDWRFQAAEINNNWTRTLLPEAWRADDEIFLDNFIPSQWADDLFVDEDLVVSTLLSTQSTAGWMGG